MKYPLLWFWVCVPLASGFGMSGTEGASFLDIPVGGAPAALGSAYTAQATNAYAPVWNPAGLAFLEQTEAAGMHVSYLESMKYEFISIAHPLGANRGIGISMQYLRPPEIAATNELGDSIGSFSGNYTAINLSYGEKIIPTVSVGVSVKLIQASIQNVHAQAFAFDIGSFYQPAPTLRLAAVISNLGTSLTFIDQRDSLPLHVRLGTAYSITSSCTFTLDGVLRKNRLHSFHTGVEWQAIDHVTLRGGYHTDTLQKRSAIGGMTAGVGLSMWGHEFSYAWVPFEDLGTSHYFSLHLRFGRPPAPLFTQN